MDQDQILEVLLKQNQQLIDALTRSSPVEILKALNPPQNVLQYKEPWQDDTGHPQPPEDPWGDPNVTPDKVISGWTEPPFKIPEEVDSGSASDAQPTEG